MLDDAQLGCLHVQIDVDGSGVGFYPGAALQLRQFEIRMAIDSPCSEAALQLAVGQNDSPRKHDDFPPEEPEECICSPCLVPAFCDAYQFRACSDREFT